MAGSSVIIESFYFSIVFIFCKPTKISVLLLLLQLTFFVHLEYFYMDTEDSYSRSQLF